MDTQKNCIFDFINIATNTIFECKLNIKDFNDEQFKKYKLTDLSGNGNDAEIINCEIVDLDFDDCSFYKQVYLSAVE